MILLESTVIHYLNKFHGHRDLLGLSSYLSVGLEVLWRINKISENRVLHIWLDAYSILDLEAETQTGRSLASWIIPRENLFHKKHQNIYYDVSEKLLFCLSHITFSSLCAQEAAGVTLINQHGKSLEACFYLGYLVVLERWKLKANGIKQKYLRMKP